MPMALSHQNTVAKVLAENPPLFFADIYDKYVEYAGADAIGTAGVRKHLNALISMGIVVRGSEYYKGRGYQYRAQKAPVAGVATSSEIIYGTQVAEARDFLSALLSTKTHKTFNNETWDGLRINLARLLLSSSPETTLDIPQFAEQLNAYKEALIKHLGEINTLINGDIWSEEKREAIYNSIEDPDTVVLSLNQYVEEKRRKNDGAHERA